MSTHGVARRLHRGHVAGRDRDRQRARRRPRRARADRPRRRLPAAISPNRLIVLETEGWPDARRRDQGGVRRSCWSSCRRAGVTLLRRARPSVGRGAGEGDRQRPRRVQRDHELGEPLVPARPASTQHPDGVSARAKATLLKAEAMTPDDYRAALLARAAGAASPRRAGAAGRRRDHALLPRPRAAVVGRRARASRWRRARPATSSSTRRARCCSRRP